MVEPKQETEHTQYALVVQTILRSAMPTATYVVVFVRFDEMLMSHA
jgi:hypothetical protein